MTSQGPSWPSPENQPTDRLQRASPFAGRSRRAEPSWWVQGEALALPNIAQLALSKTAAPR